MHHEKEEEEYLEQFRAKSSAQQANFMKDISLVGFQVTEN